MNTLPGRRSATIHIFLADGQPDGLREVEKLGWTGQAVVCPLWVPKTSSAGWIDAKRTVERRPYGTRHDYIYRLEGAPTFRH